MEIISKRAENKSNFRRRFLPFESARAAMRSFLQTIEWGSEGVILMPSYIGWSSREGSGVFDPVSELGLRFVFYKLDEYLAIDISDLKYKLTVHRPRVVLLIHYFGFVDANFRQVIELSHAAGALVLEDAAHAMLTDVIGGQCGRDGDACLYSLHKMLPSESGGALVINNQVVREAKSIEDDIPSRPSWRGGPWQYDLVQISEVRRRNAVTLIELICEADVPVDLLHPEIRPGIVPQTLPIRLRSGSRDELYHEMNAAGYGVTSLYHTLVSVIPNEEFTVSFDLSKRILNLPVHQDVDIAQLRGLVMMLKKLLSF